MAVELLTFPSASAQIHKGSGDGEMELVGIHEHVKGIDQCQTFLRSDNNQNGEDFRSEVDRLLKIILLEISQALAASQTQKKNSPSAHDGDITFSRNDESEVPVLTCGDGGHRCPYFPCPYCHRSRSVFGPENNHNVHNVHNVQEKDLFSRVNDQSVPVLTCGDGGHRCPYFPCPYCHRSRSITGTESGYSVDSPNLDCKSDRSALMRDEEDIISQVNPRSNAHVEFGLISRIDDQSAVPVLTYPDGHRCPYFPCPICHRSR